MNTKSEKFRIAAKRVYLTYSKVDKTLDCKRILAEMLNKQEIPSFNYLIAKESHDDTGIHFHVLLIAYKKFDIKNSKTLDIKHEENTYHGNYQPVRSIERVVQYVCKDGEYITDLENIRDGKYLTLKEMLIDDAKNMGYIQALVKHCETLPNKALASVSLSASKKYFQELNQIKQSLTADCVDTPFKLKDFNLNKTMKAWVENPNKTLVLVGESGVGKTGFCKAFVKHRHLKTLLVNHREDLKRLDASYDAIIVDDANLHELENTQILSLIDNQVNKTLRVLYTSVFKKANLIQMIAMNRSEFIKLTHVMQDKRIARRMLFQQVNETFIKNLNVNIQINNSTININNNNKTQNITFAESKKIEKKHIEKTLRDINDYIQSNTDLKKKNKRL